MCYQLCCAAGSTQFIFSNRIVAGIVSRDYIGVSADSQVTEGGCVVDTAAGKAIFIVGGLSITTGYRSACGGIAGVNIHTDFTQGIVGRADSTGNNEDVADNMISGYRLSADLHVRGHRSAIGGVTGVDIALLTVGGKNLIEDISTRVDIQTNGSVRRSVGSGFQLHRSIAGFSGTGFAENTGCLGGCKGAVRGVICTFIEVGFFLLDGRSVAVKAVLLNNGRVILVTHVTVIRTIAIDPNAVSKLVHTILTCVSGAILPVVTGAVVAGNTGG